jgi:hypothetical protein
VFLDTSIVPLMPLLEAGKKVCILEVLLDAFLKLVLDLVALIVFFWLFLDLFQSAFKNSFPFELKLSKLLSLFHLFLLLF